MMLQRKYNLANEQILSLDNKIASLTLFNDELLIDYLPILSLCCFYC